MYKYIIGLIALVFCGFAGFMVGQVSAEPSYISYTWTEKQQLNCVELSEMLGVEVVGVQYNGIDTGKTQKNMFGFKEKIYEDGVKIWFAEPPTSEQLEKLDIIFSQQDLKRNGGTTIADKFSQLEDSIESIEK